MQRRQGGFSPIALAAPVKAPADDAISAAAITCRF
jgi:hypothetical protein